jgi:8-oxo-dGTP diphosphatase
MEEQNLPGVSMIIERQNQGEKEILIQTRWKPQRDPKYSGTIEIPAGAIELRENVTDAVVRETKEETGLDVRIKNLKTTAHYCPQIDDEAFAFTPFCGQQQLRGGKPWIGFVFLCEVIGGELKPQPEEVKDLRWISAKELNDLFKTHPERFFALQMGVLELYFHYCGIY